MKRDAKLEGFDGEVRVVIPPLVIRENINNKQFSSFYVTDIGYYPKARNHFCKRPNGSPEHILLHCVDGRGTIYIHNEEYSLEPNQYMVIPANVPHTYQANPQNPWTIYWMHFLGSQSQYIAENIFTKARQGENVLSFDGELKATFNRFCRLLDHGYGKGILEFIGMNLPHFFSGYLYPEIYKNTDKGQDDVIATSIEFLRLNLGNKIGLTEIATSVHLSVSHFSKLFKSRTGYSPIEYLNHLKIQKACYLLQFSEKRISLISYELGFDDQYYFSRLFKGHMGVSPLQYRNSLNHNNNIIH